MSYQVFISYRRETAFLMAQVIYDRLKAKGIKCFMDFEEMNAGEFNREIIDAIHQAPNFIIILPPGALDNCVNEGDWVRKEIFEAVKEDKNIIPITYETFHWPNPWPENMPNEIKMISNRQAVSMSKEYLGAMIEKVVKYLKDIPTEPVASPIPETKPETPLSTSEFFAQGVYKNSLLDSLDMAFHAGSEWRRDSDKLDILRYLGENSVKARILVNDSAAAEAVCSHMRQPLKKYVSFDQSAMDWLEIQSFFPQSIEVRVCPVPLLHRLYIIRNKDQTGMVNVKYYSYGSYSQKKDFRLAFSSPQFQYGLYTGEFDYLWSISSPLKQ